MCQGPRSERNKIPTLINRIFQQSGQSRNKQGHIVRLWRTTEQSKRVGNVCERIKGKWVVPVIIGTTEWSIDT